MFRLRTNIIACLCLFILGIFVFTRGLSIHGLEYRDDEIFYYKSTQEMLYTGNILSPTYFGEDRFQKPILYYWLVLFSYKIFGVSWFGARFVAVFFAALSVCLTWLIGKMLFDRRVATLSAIILMTVPLFFRHAKNVVPDMVLNCFIVGALYCALCFMKRSFGIFGGELRKDSAATKYSILFFICCALGFMVKGFIALIVPFLTVIFFSLLHRNKKILSAMRFGRGLLIVLLIVCPWFLYMIATHGQSYLNFMLIDETKNRLISEGSGNIVLKVAVTFLDHCLFYLNVIGSYFAPWSVFLIGAIPLAFLRIRSKGSKSQGLSFLLLWFFVVFCFFSLIYFSINHYMLVLTTPFALLVSYFFLENIDRNRLGGKIIYFARKYFPVIIFTVSSLAFSFLFVFLAGAPKEWLFVFLLVYIVTIVGVRKSSNTLIAPLSLGILILVVFAQSSLLAKAGVTSHATLQKFSVTIHQSIAKAAPNKIIIGIGSHDIHEKEFQVYFEQKVIKAAGSGIKETDERLTKLFATDDQVYCLMIEKDFDRFLKGMPRGTFEVIQEDYIFRRRMYIDKAFFVALLKLDQTTIHHYLKEKIILIRKS